MEARHPAVYLPIEVYTRKVDSACCQKYVHKLHFFRGNKLALSQRLEILERKFFLSKLFYSRAIYRQ